MTKECFSAFPGWLQRPVEAYARHQLVRRGRWRLRFATFAGVRPGDHVLDVATGPGYNAYAFTRRAAAVLGLWIQRWSSWSWPDAKRRAAACAT